VKLHRCTYGFRNALGGEVHQWARAKG
jgi:hypothetical protein